MEEIKRRGRPKGSKNKQEYGEAKKKRIPGQLKLNLFPTGRPKGSKKKVTHVKGGAAPKGLRLKMYENVLSDQGVIVSGTADQYGRILEAYVNEKGEWDLKPSGHCIAARH
jgi:hypothetical protein